jgi:hypothetical protein
MRTGDLTMKEIDIEKVRSAILSLQSNGKHELATVVWDLLDNYVSTPPQPIVFPATPPAITFPPGARGASAWSGLPKCQVSRFNAAEQHCPRHAVGVLNAHANNKSWKVCAEHGEKYDGDREGSPYAVDWVQTFFGDENSAADVAAYAAQVNE